MPGTRCGLAAARCLLPGGDFITTVTLVSPLNSYFDSFTPAAARPISIVGGCLYGFDMRFLHTSDWHIGRTFHGHSLLADQEEILSVIADLVALHQVDVVLVAGDLYDRAIPSADSVQLAHRALARIREAGAQIIISSGNHDSAPRLGAFSSFLSAGGLHIRSQIAELAEPILFSDNSGAIAVYAIPYLEPDIAAHLMKLPKGQGHGGVLCEAMRMIRDDLAGRPTGTRSVVLAHAFVVGGSPSDSERSIDVRVPPNPTRDGTAVGEFKVGTVGTVPAQVFDGIDYVALGHLHGRQRVDEAKRYSGSPLPYSFSESSHRKGVWLVDIDATGLAQVQPIDLPVIRPLATIRGDLSGVLAGNDDLIEHYLTVELTDEIRPVDPMRRLREKFPFTVRMEWLPAHDVTAATDFAVSRRGVPDAELIEAFMADCRGAALSVTEADLVLEALTELRIAEGAR